MRLAVSNIAWPADRDEEVAGLLGRLGVDAIEVAPTKVWASPLETSPNQVRRYRRVWADRGFEVVAAQALLFGRPELTIFESAPVRRNTLDYLRGILRVCGGLGATAAVFGSPRNRLCGDLPADQVQPIAEDFFGELARSARDEGVAVVLEANPPDYGADFVVRAAEAIDLVRRVDHPGLRFHADSACMTLIGDPVEEVLSEGADLLAHFHISEPQLAPIGSGGVDHGRFARALGRVPYAGAISIEMREPQPFTMEELERAVRYARRCYLGEAHR